MFSSLQTYAADKSQVDLDTLKFDDIQLAYEAFSTININYNKGKFESTADFKERIAKDTSNLKSRKLVFRLQIQPTQRSTLFNADTNILTFLLCSNVDAKDVSHSCKDEVQKFANFSLKNDSLNITDIGGKEKFGFSRTDTVIFKRQFIASFVLSKKLQKLFKSHTATCHNIQYKVASISEAKLLEYNHEIVVVAHPRPLECSGLAVSDVVLAIKPTKESSIGEVQLYSAVFMEMTELHIYNTNSKKLVAQFK
jgi:hypothetical protein